MAAEGADAMQQLPEGSAGAGLGTLPAAPVPPEELSFDTLCNLLYALKRVDGAQTSAIRQDHLQRFITNCILRPSPRGAFSVFRLLMPHLDRFRPPSYLKEVSLPEVLCRALCVDPRTDAGRKIIEFRDVKKGASGKLCEHLQEHVYSRCCTTQQGTPAASKLTIRELNDALDELAAAAQRWAEQAGVLRALLSRVTHQQAYWLTHIIMREVPLGLADKTVFLRWHPDAYKEFQCGMDLRSVFDEMQDPAIPHRPAIEFGRPAAPQLAKRANSPAEAFKLTQSRSWARPGEPFVIDQKLDGERQQVHFMRGTAGQYWSRSGIDHAVDHEGKALFSAFDPVLEAQLGVVSAVLDGELLVWNKRRRRFEAFGSLRPAFKAVQRGTPGSAWLNCAEYNGSVHGAAGEWDAPVVRDCEVVYAVFDVVMVDGEVVAERPLLERHRLLQRLLKKAPPEGYCLCGNTPITGRILPLIPGSWAEGHFTPFNLRSQLGRTKEDVKDALVRCIRGREEGVVIKALRSAWRPGCRSGAWIKLKPEYFASFDIDCVIMGAAWGTNALGGLLSEYLVGVREGPANERGGPLRIMSFIKVSTGVTMAERRWITDKLKPLLVDTPPPACVLTGNEPKSLKWVSDPLKSVVVDVLGDLRFMQSEHYATRFSLRFPRIKPHGIRHDKTAAQVTTHCEVIEFAEQKRNQIEAAGDAMLKRYKERVARKKLLLVPPTLRPADMRGVARESNALARRRVFVIAHAAPEAARRELHEAVHRLGGTICTNMVEQVTHVVAALDLTEAQRRASRDWTRAHALGRDILAASWLRRCAARGRKVDPRPGEYLEMGMGTIDSTPGVDEHGDRWVVDSSAADVSVLLRRMRAEFLPFQDLAAAMLSGGGAARGPAPPLRQLQVLVEAEMVAAGVGGAPSALLRGCELVFLTLDGTADAAGTAGTAQQPAESLCPALARLQRATAARDARLRRLRLQQLSLRAQLHGAVVSATVQPCTTHLLCSSQGSAAAVSPEALLAAVSAQAGRPPAAAALRNALASGCMLVRPAWLQAALPSESGDSCDALEAEAEQGADLLLALEGGVGQAEAWPWERFVPPPAPEAAKTPPTLRAQRRGRAFTQRSSGGNSSQRTSPSSVSSQDDVALSPAAALSPPSGLRLPRPRRGRAYQLPSQPAAGVEMMMAQESEPVVEAVAAKRLRTDASGSGLLSSAAPSSLASADITLLGGSASAGAAAAASMQQLQRAATAGASTTLSQASGIEQEKMLLD